MIFFCSLKGLRPVLRLMTEDGAIFENDDPISVTFGEVISSTVLDWKLPHISKRYIEVCQQLKTGEYLIEETGYTTPVETENLL